MIVAVHLPRFSLLVALLAARQPLDAPTALGPPPGEPQVIGLCTAAAEAQGVKPGLRVGEALARCPRLELVTPDPDAVADAHERFLVRLEDLGAAVESVGPGSACFTADGLYRLHGGLDGVLRRVRTVLPVGADGRIGVAPTRFVALEAAFQAPPRRPLIVRAEDVIDFLATLPVARLPLPAKLVAALFDLGIRTIGAVAALPRAAALERLGFSGISAWKVARGEHDQPVRPRIPPEPLEVRMEFPEAVGALPALESAATLLVTQLADRARARGRALRSLVIRARLSGDGSFVREVVLRDATTDPDRIALAVLPHLVRISAPVEVLIVRADASGHEGGHQLTVLDIGRVERARRTGEAVLQTRAALGDQAVMRVIELDPLSRLPERRWALVPFDTSPEPGRSA